MSRHRRGGVDPQQAAPLVIAVLVLLVVGVITGVAHLGRWLSGGPVLPGNPFTLTTALLLGRTPWPAGSGTAGLLLAVPLLLLLAAVIVVGRRRARRRSRVDHAARYMASTADLRPLLRGTGAPIGRLLGGSQLRRPRQWVTVQLWGPRQGKTSTQGIEAVLDAAGPVVATSNKRDLLDATREPRAGRGIVWVVDPNGIAGESPAFWWNPLSYVTDETRARQLARIFTDAQREPGARTDAYFDPAGQALLGNLLLAAAVAGRPITDVYGWLTRATNRAPVELLRGHGYLLQADAVEAVIDLHPKQRGGVYGTAEQTMSFLTSRAVQAWVTPPSGSAFGVQFDPDGFVRSTDTLYLLSKEGEGSGGPIVTALTAAVCEAAVSYARTSPGGRLPVPMRVELDEAANICRWRDLPDLYSHFGSQNIEVTTYLQSSAQGEGVWGREGMRKLWSAANLRIVGPGVAEVSFLADVSKLVGEYDLTRTSSGYGHAGRSVNYTTERRPVLDVAELGALPGPDEHGNFARARMLVLAAGLPPVLARPVPWWETDRKAAVAASIALHEPAQQAPPLRRPVPPLVEHDVPRPGAGNPWTRS